MRFAFGLPIGLVWVLSVGSSASMAASCPPRANKPSNWCVQSKGSTQPQSHQPSAGTQPSKKSQDSHHWQVPKAPPNPYPSSHGSAGRITPDFSVPAVPPNPYSPGTTPTAGSIDPRSVPSQQRTLIPRQGNSGQRLQDRDSPDQSAPTPSIPVEYVIVCRVDTERYCPIASDSPVPPGTMCTCEEEGLQGFTE
jgi:hypothetical protein